MQSSMTRHATSSQVLPPHEAPQVQGPMDRYMPSRHTTAETIFFVQKDNIPDVRKAMQGLYVCIVMERTKNTEHTSQ